jgi:carbamoyl-phosphate synthase/aspartate carbamoyltransferase/dihydroorotase
MPKEIIKLPGLIDPHVHLCEPGAKHKEDFETGTKAAIAGGYTTILDMPNNPEPTVSLQALKKKIELGQNRIFCDVGFHFGATLDSSRYFELIKNQVFGLKIYMNHTTGPLLVDKLYQLQTIFSTWPKGKPVLVHAEGETLETAINLAKEYRQNLHICHVAQKMEIEMIKAAKENGLKVTCEVTPHHLFLTESDAKILGPFGVMRPPIATESDRQALWDNLNVIDIIASDHAPHTEDEKLLSKPTPFGVLGLETTLPLLLSAVAEGKLTLEKLVDATSTKPRQIFGISDQPETYTEVDLKESYTIDSSKLKTKCAWTPYDGKRVTGKVVKVVLRGNVVFDGDKIENDPIGKVIYPI